MVKCEYCRTLNDDGDLDCRKCGAPLPTHTNVFRPMRYGIPLSTGEAYEHSWDDLFASFSTDNGSNIRKSST